MTSPSSEPGWQRPGDSAARPASARLVDPEDDLAAANYGGDFATTRIPPFGAPEAPAGSIPPPTSSAAGYGLFQDPEPLPYVQPVADVAHPVASPLEIAPVDAEQRLKAAGRRGTQDLGLLLLRVALGVVFIAHGLQKAFGWWGGEGLDGFKAALIEAGYQHAELLTYVAAGAQIAAGVLLVLGLFTPVAAAGALAFLVNSVLVTFTCWCSRRWRRRSSWSGPVVTASTVDGVGPADRSSGPSSRYCWERAAAWRPGCSCTALIPSPDS